MKKIIILDSYHSSDYHLEILKECLRRLKTTDYKLLLTSHLPIPTEIQSQVDYCVYDRENILTDSVSHYWYANSEFRVTINQPGHSVAICRNMISGVSLAHAMGFEYFYSTQCDNLFRNEDLKSLDNFLNEMVSQNKKMIFHQQEELYHTLLFGGEIEYFKNRVHLPRNTEEYNSYTQNGFLEMDFFHYLSKDQDQFLIKSCDVDGRFEGFENSEMNKISCVGIICEVLLSNRGHFLYLMNNVNQKLDCKVNENSFELFPGNFWYSPALGEINVEIFDGKFTLTKKFFVSNENSDLYSEKGSLEFFTN
jgi:hypothetical protein